MTLTKEFRFEADDEAGNDDGGNRGGFGRSAGERRIRIQARFNNLLNHSQPRAYSGVLSSPPVFTNPPGTRAAGL